MSEPGPIEVLHQVASVLEELEIPYVVGGSFASGIHGIPRATRDADLVVDMTGDQAQLLASSLASEYYVDVTMIRDSLAEGISFNVIHLRTQFKIDFFPARGNPFRQSNLTRGIREQLGSKLVYVATPEDILLAKLSWYREGGEVSDRQWEDILGIVEVQGERLDAPYLQRWAGELGVEELLGRCSREATGQRA